MKLSYKFLFILVVILLSIYGIVGIPWPLDQIGVNLEKNIKLGLDLKGGSQLVLQIQVQDAFKSEADTVMERIREKMTGIEYGSMEASEPKDISQAESVEITVRGVPSLKGGDFKTLVEKEAGSAWEMTPVNATDYKLKMKKDAALDLRKSTVTAASQTIQKKIDGLGLAEATVQPRGSEQEAQILVQMPGVDDPARVKTLLKDQGKLEWAELKSQNQFSSQEDARREFPVLPPNSRLVAGAGGAPGAESFYLVSRTPVVTGRDLKSATPAQDQMGRWEVAFILSQDAGRRFAAFTGANIGKRTAIILNDKVLSAPTINDKIQDSGRIMGMGSKEAASDLTLNLKAGSLPAGIEFLEERSVGPSLGSDSIRSGILAGVVGLVAVVFAMLVYYKRSGINAMVALILNALILIAILGYLGAALTLPGIAGIILLIGMAVDSNVLIFERIREELRGGKGVLAAIEAGFSKAFATIIDTHMTTVVSCAFLFYFGSPQVKGFAVTLVIGLIANLFTAVFVSKLIFDWENSGKKQVGSLSI